MKRYIITAASGLLVFFILCSCLTLLIPVQYFHTRYTPDYQFNDDLVPPETVKKDRWVVMTAVTYADGAEVSRTQVRKPILSNYYSVTQQKDGSTSEVNIFSNWNRAATRRYGDDWYDPLDDGHFRNRLVTEFDCSVVHGRLTYAGVYSGKGLEGDDSRSQEPLHNLYFYYDEKGNLTTQENSLPNNTYIIATYTYEGRRISGANLTDGKKNPIGHITYEYDGGSRTETRYDAEGKRLGTVQSNFDLLGRIRHTRKWDAQGNLLQEVNYSYNFFKAFPGWRITWLVIPISLSIYAAQEVNMNLKQREEDKKSKQ